MCTACWGINKVVFVHFHPLILIGLEYSILLLGARSPLSTIMDLQILCCEGIWIQSDPSTNSFTYSKPSSVTNSHSQYDRILKKNQQMYALLVICLSLCPHPKLVEESVNNQLQENYAEKMLHMQCSDEAICLMNYFSMPAPSSSPHPHTNMASPSSTLTRMHIGCS